jgi:hypothetical protein
MNDEFMHQLYEEPRPEFGNTLYERISTEPQSRFAQVFLHNRAFRYTAISFVVLFLIAAGVYAVYESPWDKIGNIWVKVQRTLPPPDVPPGEETVMEMPEPACVSVKEAKEILRFDLRVPTWIPGGFTFRDEICGIDRLSDYAYLYWEGPDQNTVISINVENRRIFNMSTQKHEITSPVIWFPVAPGSYEEVQVKGKSAVLVHGDWGAPWMTEEMVNSTQESKWDWERAIQLYWVDGEVFYHLYTQAELSPEEVIRIAESVR